MSEITTPPEQVTADERSQRIRQLRLDERLDDAKRRSSGASWLPWVLCFFLSVTWVFVGIRSYRSVPTGTVRTEGPRTGDTQEPSEPKKIAAPPPASGSTVLEMKGYLVPAHQIAVSPIDVGGQLVELNIVEGQILKQGEIIARIDSSSYQAAYEEASSAVSAAKQRLEAAERRLAELKPESVRAIELDQLRAQIREAEASRSRAEDEYRRLTAMKGASGRELDQAESDFLGSKARVDKLKADLEILQVGPRKEKILGADADVKAADADVKVAEARLKQAKWRLDNCVIRAPINGSVLTKKSERGNLVNPLATGGTFGSICEIADLADLEIECAVPERDVGKLKKGMACRIRSEAFPDRTYQGTLDRIMPIAQRSDSTVKARVRFQLSQGEEPGQYLKPEMGAVVSFLNSEPPSAGKP